MNFHIPGFDLFIKGEVINILTPKDKQIKILKLMYQNYIWHIKYFGFLVGLSH